MAGLRVLFVPHPDGDRLFDPWGRDVVELVGERHEIRVLDPRAPLGDQFANADVVVDHGSATSTHEMADASSNVRLWQILGTGYDHFDLDYWRSKQIPVANCPGTGTAAALAETAMMFTLMLARRYPEASANLHAGVLCDPAGSELDGLRMCILGFGASGRELAVRARAFGMTIAAIDVRAFEPREVEQYELAFAGGPEAIDEQLAQADVVSLHLHLNAATRLIIGRERLAQMKRSALLINVSRGELVDEDALLAALRSGAIGGAGLDVFAEEPVPADSPFLALQNVVAAPHIAGVTRQASRRRAEMTAENVDRVAAGLTPLHLVG
jgi:phosphoglycerate dehydrogenase-like enzyme